MTDTGYFNDDGIQDVLDAYTGRIATSLFQAGKVRLFKNNITVSKTNVIGDFTEATFAGYAAITLTTTSFNASTLSAHVASAVAAAAFVFTCTGSTLQTCYGGYITNAGNTKLLACWNFAAGGQAMTNNGDSISTTPTLTVQSLN